MAGTRPTRRNIKVTSNPTIGQETFLDASVGSSAAGGRDVGVASLAVGAISLMSSVSVDDILHNLDFLPLSFFSLPCTEASSR